MPMIQSRPMVATDFEDIALFDHREVKDWQQRLNYNGPIKTPGVIIPNSGDLHASVQSVSSTLSASTTNSDSSSLRSSLSSLSSPASAANQFPGHTDGSATYDPALKTKKSQSTVTAPSPLTALHKALDESTATVSKVPSNSMPNAQQSTPYGRRRSVPALLDNTSMASLTIKATNGTRSRKQRELEYEADQDDDVWPGDSLMFNVPMSPALYAQQRMKQYHMTDGSRQAPPHTQLMNRVRPSRPQQIKGQELHNETVSQANLSRPTDARFSIPIDGAPLDGIRKSAPTASSKPGITSATPSVSPSRRKSSGYQRHKPSPSIHENHSATALRSQEPPERSSHSASYYDLAHIPQQPIDGASQSPYYRSPDNALMDHSVSSLPSLLSRRGSCADSTVASIDGLNSDASELTLELCKFHEMQQQSRRQSSRSNQARNSRDSDVCDSTAFSISSLAMSETDAPSPSPNPASRDSFESGNDSRRSSLTRPDNLPPKTPEEERKHLKEYEQLLKDAAAAEKKKQQKKEEQMKQRAQQSKSDNVTWSNWLAKGGSMRSSSDTKWRGIPERLRGAVWFKCMGSDLQKLRSMPNVNTAHYQLIANDTEKVWPECTIFGSGRPLHDSLIFVVQRYLGIYPEVQYNISSTYLSALLLSYLDTPQALTVLLNILKPDTLAFSILSGNERLTSANYVSFQKIFNSKFDRSSAHLAKKGVTYSELLNPVLSSIFTTVIPTPELSARLFDVFIFDGDSFLSRAALGLISMNEAWLYVSKSEILYQMQHPRVEEEDETMKIIREVTRK